MREGKRGEVRGKRLEGREEWEGREEGRRGKVEGEGERVGEATHKLHLSQNFVRVVK